MTEEPEPFIQSVTKVVAYSIIIFILIGILRNAFES